MLEKSSWQRFPWFTFGMTGIFLLSAALRFWNLGRFNTLVFDEVYYAKFASNYLNQIPFFDGHPPLSKYIIAIGMWLGSRFPVQQELENGLSGSLVAPWTYRWVNALLGSLLPILIAGIAYRLCHRRSYALVAGGLAVADGMLLVESRFALNNVHLILFGLLGQWSFLLALDRQGLRRWLWLTFAGISFGAAIAIKWNGLWFLLGLYWLWAMAWGLHWFTLRWPASRFDRWGRPRMPSYSPLQNLTQLNVLHILVYLAIVPVLVYRLLWIPHLRLNPESGFWRLQQQILQYHQQVGGNTADVHPYCSAWYTWPWMIRPVAYFYQRVRTPEETVPALPPLPDAATQFVYDVHSIGNPVLWWLSTLAILCLLVVLMQPLCQWIVRLCRRPATAKPSLSLTPSLWMALYLTLNYLANLLPWVRVTRCTFLYHYLSASLFSGLTLAWFIEQGLKSPFLWHRRAGIGVLLLVAIAFVFWMPLYLGMPMSVYDFRLRMWLPTWI